MTDQPDMSQLKHARIVSGLRGMLGILMDDDLSGSELAKIICNIRGDLGESERLLLSSALLNTFTADTALEHVRLEFEGRGMPPVPLTDDPRPDAKLWASEANASELMAYACASIMQMQPRRRVNLRKWLDDKYDERGDERK